MNRQRGRGFLTLISVEQTTRFCSSLRVDQPLGNYFLQNDVQFWCQDFFIEGTSDTSPTFEWHYSWMFHYEANKHPWSVRDAKRDALNCLKNFPSFINSTAQRWNTKLAAEWYEYLLNRVLCEYTCIYI